MIGAVIGNYKIISKIGEGGMGSVFLAEHTKLSRKVAIKNLHDVLVKNEEIRKRFQNEAQAMAKLQHENIVNLLDFEENEDGLFLIMEFVDGAPLDELLKANSIPADQSLRIIQSILEGLKYAHKKDIVHRDIKPSNILIKGEDMSPKILDFGIAKMLGTDNSMTKTGTQMGTVFYMSPEQVKGEKVDQRSDIYAVGVTLFQLINGSNPYANLSTEYEVYNKIVTEELPDLTSKGVDQGVVDIISQATAKNVDERFQSCQDMIDAISDFLAGKKTSKKGKTKPKQKAPTSDKNLTNKKVQSGNKKGLWILLILLLLGGIGGGGYYLYDQGKFDEWFGGSDDDDDDYDDASSDTGYDYDYESEAVPESVSSEYSLCECLELAYNNGGTQENLSNVIANDNRCNWLNNIPNGPELVDDNYSSCTFYMDHYGIEPSWQSDDNMDEIIDEANEMSDYDIYDNTDYAGDYDDYVGPTEETASASEEVYYTNDAIEEFPDVEAGFPGGPSAMMSWINSHVVYPQTSIEMNEQGRVFLSFVVEKDGSITDVVVERGVSMDLDREARRVIRSMPNWSPGVSAGRAVRARCRLPINFLLN